jgi:misacylated tRNA(Ala) deacylase
MDDRMTARLFLDDATLATTSAIVIASGSEGIVLDRTVFYARGGGQPGDTGSLRWDAGETPIVEAVKGEGGAILHLPAPDVALPSVGAWWRRRSTGRGATLTCVCIQRCTCCAA